MILGTAKEMVTPHVLVAMGGYAARTEPFKGIHDDLYVRSCLLKNGDKQILIISFDIIQFNYSLNERIQAYANERYGLGAQEVIISYSHTHAGPEVKHYRDKDNSNKVLADLEDFLLDRTKCCIDKTFLNLFEGEAFYTKASVDFNVNRRKKVGDETVMAPNYTGIKDTELWVLILKDLEGNIRGLFYNYSCHPVTLSSTLYISAEYPGRINQLLDAFYYGCVSGFLQGSAGNMRPMISAKGGKFLPCSFEEVDQMASSIALTIKNLIDKAAYKKIIPVLDAVSFTIPAAIRPIPREELVQLSKDEGSPLKNIYLRMLENYDNLNETAVIHAGIAKISNDLYLAYMGGEICYEVKQIVKKVFGEKDLFFLGYHEAVTYIPTDELIEEGGYEGHDAPLWSGFKGPFEKGIDKVVYEHFMKYFSVLK